MYTYIYAICIEICLFVNIYIYLYSHSSCQALGGVVFKVYIYSWTCRRVFFKFTGVGNWFI